MGQLLSRHRRLVVGGALAVWGGALVAFLVLVVVYGLDFFGALGGPWVLAFGVFAITGALIAWQRPGHPVGVLFLILGVVPPVANTVLALAMGPFAEHSMALRTVFVAISVSATTPIFPLMLVAVMRFPDGQLPSRRWRWTNWVAAAAMVLGATAAFSAGGWGGDAEQVLLGPPLEGRLVGVADVLSPVFFQLIIVLIAATAVSAVLRYRCSESVARQQMKWLVLAALYLLISALTLIPLHGAVATPAGASTIAVAVGVALVPVSVGIAILRHRLYDVDVVLNRTIVFAVLAVFITGLYAAIVVGVGTLVGDRSNLVLTIGTVALIAVVFEPVRARVQGWANVAVYGQRATPYVVLSAMAEELETATAAEQQLSTLSGLLADGTGAAHATVWMHEDGVLRAAACWPDHDVDEHPQVALASGEALALAGAAHAEPVRSDGTLLGALSFDRARDDPVTPRERELMAQMAGQASLVLTNARLRVRLEARLDELRASRQRLVAAQDDARRKLERDLHDGAQQQLVALKVKLGLARRMATKEAAGPALDDLLAGLADAADEAVDQLRTLARGIYPPLLEAEGLERAITTQADRAPLPVTVSAAGLRRYGREVEATVYFCVLEALSNALKHAAATALDVTLEERDGALCFHIADNGTGFHPQTATHGLGLTNMADRIDALGGTLTVAASPAGGTQVSGTIPVQATDAVETAVIEPPLGHAEPNGVVPA